MRTADWMLAAGVAIVAALLLNAGAAKLASPGQLRQAVAELAAPASHYLSAGLVRGVGAAEAVAAFGLLIAPIRLPAAVLSVALGACFVALGVLGLVRGSRVPCGCFGAASRQPLGWTNIWLGAAVMLALPATVLAGPVPAAIYSQASALFASVAAVVLCLWLNRDLVARLRKASVSNSAASEVN